MTIRGNITAVVFRGRGRICPDKVSDKRGEKESLSYLVNHPSSLFSIRMESCSSSLFFLFNLFTGQIFGSICFNLALQARRAAFQSFLPRSLRTLFTDSQETKPRSGPRLYNHLGLLRTAVYWGLHPCA